MFISQPNSTDILVVDDDPLHIRQMLTRYFEGEGSISSACGSRRTRRCARLKQTRQADIILLDLFAPRRSG